MFHFKHPTTVLIAGPTQCGKTHFLVSALRQQLIQPLPQKIVWVFGEWQSTYAELSREMPCIQFVKNFNAQLYERFDPRERNLLVLDDQMENQSAHKRSSDSVVKFFTQGSHHRNLTVVYIVQNLFNQDKSMRTVSLNAHYIIVFKNPRDATQLRTLAYQMYPENPAPLLDAFKDATTGGASAAYGYLLLDLHPTTCDAFRMLTNVFDAQPTAYVPDEYIKSASLRTEHDSFVDGSNARCTTAFSSDRRIYPPARRDQHSRRRERIAQAPGKAQRRKDCREANTQVPDRVQRPARVPSRAKRIHGRRDKDYLQRSAERRARRSTPHAKFAEAIQQSS